MNDHLGPKQPSAPQFLGGFRGNARKLAVQAGTKTGLGSIISGQAGVPSAPQAVLYPC